MGEMAQALDDFDPSTAGNVLELMARHAHQFSVDEHLAPDLSLVRAAADLLRVAKAWLSLYRTPFDDTSYEALVDAFDKGLSVHVDCFVAVLNETAIELFHVEALARVPSAGG